MNEPTINRASAAIGDLQIERQVERLQQIADPAARSAAAELVASVLELHSAALQKMLDILREAPSAHAALAAFERDDLIRSVLLLHDLHSQPVAARVSQAMNELRPRVEKFGAVVELIQADPAGIKAVIRGASAGCGSTAEMVRSMVEAALVGAAPDAAGIVVDIVGDDRTFVAIDSIQLARARANS